MTARATPESVAALRRGCGRLQSGGFAIFKHPDGNQGVMSSS
jgi:hypothetical protein